MPLYEYRCDRGHTFEVLQRMSEDPVTSCTTCSAPVQRVFHPVAVHFKGSGFYNTDYGKRRGGGSEESSGGEGKKPDSSDSGSPAKSGSAEASSGSGRSSSESGGSSSSSSSD
jgi:putative FmdB family regulatory protein